MAGMLPGVECARRRRLHPQSRRSSDAHGIPVHNFTRHPAICLYASNLESYHLPHLNKDRDNFVLQRYVDENLDATAKEAKERLDRKFQAQTKFHTRRKNDQENSRVVETRSVAVPVLRREVMCLNRCSIGLDLQDTPIHTRSKRT